MGYEASAQYYDLFGEKPDLEYYKQLAEKAGKALEIGVGTGRVALELAKVGVEVWGIDNSPAMLKIAEAKIKELPTHAQDKIKLVQADMISFDLCRKFPLAYMPSSTLSHCITTEDQVKALRCVHDHLQEDGIFAFDILLPSSRFDGALRPAGRQPMGDRTVMRWISNRSDPASQVLHTILIFEVYENNILIEKVMESSTVSLITRREVELLLEKANFEIETQFGDFSYSENITDLLVIQARKP
ncbi:MAG: class I SAM-dependent methyltransferase [Theionarchaea archaeon]|nr:class I SAM-dependent methyltransferase [Theionarchaea archaeon]MBU7037712.1 class I SAM-dependent methyltransferase [Theionarchaea archaeon]